MADGKQATSFRLTGEARKMIIWLAAHHGISQADVLEMVIRREAREQGYKSEGAE